MRDGKLFRKKGDSHSNKGEEERTKLERVKHEVINSIYGVFYILLKNNDDSSLWKFIMILVVQFVQTLSYSFDETLGKVWKSELIISYLAKFLSTFRVIFWLEKISWDVYIIIYYVCIFLIFMVIIDFIYVAYCYKNRKFPIVWPIQLLRYSCKLMTTVLFIPLLELFMSFSNCSEKENNIITHNVFTQVKCFEGIHILHVTLSYFIMIIFLSICVIITFCYYESRLGREYISKMNSNCDLVMLQSQFAYVFAFTFFGKSDYYWFQSTVLFVGSATVFFIYHRKRPYFQDKTQRVVNLLNGIFLWTNSVLIFSCFIYTLDFTANLAIFLLGLPFVIIVILNIKDFRKQYLLDATNYNSYNGEFVHNYINYYLQIIDLKDDSREAAMILKGYVNYHSEYCMLESCPLRNFKKQQQKDLRKVYGQFGQNTNNYATLANKTQITSLESHPLLLQQAKIKYTQGIKRYPKYIALRIDYAQFLLYRMHNKKDALKELLNAEKQKPSFEQQFQIFRYRNIIEDELHEGSDQAGGLDYVAAINFENHFNQFKSLIEKSALLHYEFWNHLMDDSPDLARLSDQGSKINASIQLVEDSWKKLAQQSTQTPKALRLYASYLIEILNDKELGNEQLQKAKEAALVRVNLDFGNMHEDSSDMSSFAPDGSPCVYISGEQDRLGVITQCNMSVCKVFGYSKKDDLINHEVEILMPKIYAKNHRKFLEQAIQKPPDLLTNKERQVFGKHVSGFIFPLWLSIKNLPTFLSGRQFVATLKVEKTGINKNISHLILDKNKEVIDISSTCLSMLDIDLNKFSKMKAKFDISLLLPTLFGPNYYQFQNKQGFQIEYMFPKLVEIDRNKEGLDDQDEQDGQFGEQNDDQIENQSVDSASNQNSNQNMNSARQKNMNNNNYNISIVEEEEDALLSNEDTYNTPNMAGSTKSKNSMNMKNIKYLSNVDQIAEEEEDLDDMDSQERLEYLEQFYEYKVIPQPQKSLNFQCNMTEIHFETQNLENPNPGYYIRLETLQDKLNGTAKIQKTLKQSAFQFSYDPVYRKFNRELRDRENRDIFTDKHFANLKKLKEGYLNQVKNNLQKVIPEKVQNMTYMNYLNRIQKWFERGQQGSILEDDSSEGSLNESEDDDYEIDQQINNDKRGKYNANNPPITASLLPEINPNNQLNSLITGQGGTLNELMDMKKFGEGTGKEFLKQEIDRMINVLRKKQEVGDGIRCFKRVDPGQRINPALAQNYLQVGQHGRFEEVQFSVASLFTSRSTDRSADFNDEDRIKEEDAEREKQNKNDMSSSIKSRKAFQMAINDKSVPPAIKRLTRIANVILICLLTLAIVDYSIHYKQLKDTISNYEVIDNSYKRIAEIQKVCNNVRSMIMLNAQYLTNYQGFNNLSDYVKSIKDDMLNSLNMLYDIQNEINLSQLSLSNEHDELLNEKTVNLYFKQDQGSMKSLQFSLTEAILQIQSSIFTVSNMNLKDFNETTNEDIFFLMHNSFNELHLKMLQSSNLYVQELSDRSESKLELAMILFILSIVALIGLIVILIPVVTAVNRQKDKVLSLFCEIDDQSIRILSQRCEKFVNKIQTTDDNANDDGMESNEDLDNLYAKNLENEDDDYTGMLGGFSRKKKTAKSNTRTDKFFYVKFIVIVLVIETYYAYNYGMMINYQDTTSNQLREFNMTNYLEPFYWFSLNTQREYYYNSSKPILNQNSFAVSHESIFKMYQLANNLLEIHLQNKEYVTEQYWSRFQEIMSNDMCPYFENQEHFFGSVSKCEAFSSGIANQGLILLIMDFIRMMRLQLGISQTFQNNSPNLNRAQGMKSIINSQEMYELFVIQHEFIQMFMRSLTSDFSSSIIGALSDRLQNRLFLLILILILLILGYVALWLPLVNSLTSQIYKTKLMLMIIPLEILMRMKNVGKVLQSQNFIQEKTSRGGSGGGSSHSNGDGKKRNSSDVDLTGGRG